MTADRTTDTVAVGLNELRCERFEIVPAEDTGEAFQVPRGLWDAMCAARAALQQAWIEAARTEEAVVQYVAANNPDADYPWAEWARGQFVFHWEPDS